jgi:PAS domain S-box-containing protein
MSSENESHRIASTTLDALLATLRLDFALVRLLGSPSQHVEMMGVPESAEETNVATLCFATVPLGMRGESGLLVAGARRLDFPTDNEKLLLETMASRAALTLQKSRVDRAEETLRDSEREARLIVDSIPGLVATFSASGELEYVNRETTEFFGKTFDELKHWDTAGTTHPDDVARVFDTFGRSITTGEPFEIESRSRRFDGVYRWMRSRGFPLRDEAGRIVRWYNLLTDIDEHKRTEDQLRRSEAFLLEAQRLSHTGGWGHILATGKVTSSPEIIRIYTPQPDEDTSDPAFWFGRIHPDDRARVLATFERCERERIEYYAEFRIVLPDGSIRYHCSIGHPVLNEHGELVEFVGTSMDTTEQSLAKIELERANAALRQSEHELTLIVETMPGLVWCAAPDGELTYMNQRILEYLGASLENLQEGGWAAFLHPDDRAAVIEGWARAVAHADTYETQSRLRRADGTYRWVHVVSQLGRDHSGHPTRWYGLLIDIHDRKNAEDALHVARAELTFVSRLTTLNALTASIAHELNQPLTGVMTNASTCLRMLDRVPPDVAGARETVGRMIRDGNRASEVISRLRALFSKREFTGESLDLSEVVREVLTLTAWDLERNRIVLQLDLATALPMIFGDRIQLQQVILNLLRNASDAMTAVHDGSRLLIIRTESEGTNGVRLTLQDTGPGLAAQNTESLFDAFHTTKSNGMGIGLFVSRSIIERHCGRIWAEPNDGPGATFSFSIPRLPADDATRQMRI